MYNNNLPFNNTQHLNDYSATHATQSKAKQRNAKQRKAKQHYATLCNAMTWNDMMPVSVKNHSSKVT